MYCNRCSDPPCGGGNLAEALPTSHQDGQDHLAEVVVNLLDNLDIPGLGGLASAPAAGGKAAPSQERRSSGAKGKQLDWMNRMISVMWPNMRQAIIAKANTEFMIRLRHELLQRPELEIIDCSLDFDPGTQGPTVSSVRVSKDKGSKDELDANYIRLELDFHYLGKDFKLRPNLSLSLKNVPLPSCSGIGVAGFDMQGAMTVVLGPLTDEIPCFQALQFFFLDPPEVEVTLTGMPPLGDIGRRIVSTALKNAIVKQLTDMMVLPNRMIQQTQKTVPLETLIAVKSPLPIGVFEVEVLEARDLLALDTFSSDPFVEVTIGNAKLRTSTAPRSLEPKWRDGPEYLLVYSLDQKVRIEAYDDDVLTEDDMLGVLRGYSVYHLAKELESQPEGKWLNLEHPTDNGKTAGELRLRGRFLRIDALGDLPDRATARLREEERKDAYPEPPRLVTVKILGMEGEQTKWFAGAKAQVTWQPHDLGVRIQASQSMTMARIEGEKLTRRGSLQQVGLGLQGMLSTGRAMKATAQLFTKAAQLGFGSHEPGAPLTGGTSKAKVHHHTKHAKGVGSAAALDPTIVRAIEQLLHRECWEKERIAAMFGISLHEVEIAAALRTNFEVVWHQAIHFIQPPVTKPCSGRLRIEVSLPSKQLNFASAQIKKNYSGVLMAKEKKDEFYATVASNGLVGTVELDLASDVRGDDKPHCRRVRGRLRRQGALDNEDVAQDPQFKTGEGQCDPSVGPVVPGVLIEFCVEIRTLVPQLIDDADGGGQHRIKSRPSRAQSLESHCSKRAVIVVVA